MLHYRHCCADNIVVNISFFFPWHWMALLTSAKNFRDNPVIGSPALNRRGLHLWRKRWAHSLAARRRRKLGVMLPLELKQSCDRDGMIKIADFLSPQQWQSLLQEVHDHTLPMLEMAQPPALTRRAYLDAVSCKNMPVTTALLTHPLLHHLMQYIAGYPGQAVIALQCIHSDAPTTDASDPQTMWHTDTFHSTAKAWLLLHDLAADQGPFAYIPGTHKLTLERQTWEQSQSVMASRHSVPMHAKGSWRASEQELSAMGYAQTFTAALPANTLIVADTGGFHRRTPCVRPTARVEIYLSLRRTPFFAGLFPSLLSLPWIKKTWARKYTQLSHSMHRHGFKVWTPAPDFGLLASEKQLIERNLR
ncbi:phytanoyl-CoA dioxygenase family protein [Variovorax sp. PCZ-1]|uniref:phytanoyl-CoA dioxygenase family protein n=1 Tax=Variovorax sp. PCZ-1 TaxID=2835533 RepID=UPI001BCCB166|nr:phytanoyl-CoA dioxygenase family protein [Variovorax sp. PCZ-1]MBS7807551.1 phytanoyl-CoA dioxygenase family protein [Variovorax sp. PCZ-1]